MDLTPAQSSATDTRFRNRNDIRPPPIVREGIPLIGPAAAFNRDPLGFLTRCRERYGDVFTVNLLLYKATFVLGAAAQQRFFAAPKEVLDLDAAIRHVLRSVVGDPEELARLYSYPEFMTGVIRKGLTKPEYLERYVEQATVEARRAFERWAEQGEIDLFRECSRLVNFVNIRTLLGQDVLAETVTPSPMLTWKSRGTRSPSNASSCRRGRSPNNGVRRTRAPSFCEFCEASSPGAGARRTATII